MHTGDKNLADYSQQKAFDTPNDIAIYLENGSHILFGSIFEEAMALASALSDLGLKAGDVVSFQLPNWRETVAIDIAAAWLGVVVNPIIPIYRDRELAFILADSQARCLFIPGTYRGQDFPGMIAGLRPQLPELRYVITVRNKQGLSNVLSYEDLVAQNTVPPPMRHPTKMDAPKLIMYTSGTTGRAKAVVHSHRSLATALANGIHGWSLIGGDIMLMPSPVTHVTGFANGIELPFFSHCQSALMERWDVARAVAYIKKVGATACVSATPFLQELVELARSEGEVLPTLRLFACGGASVPPTLIDDVHATLTHCRACRVYGCTEAPLITVGFIDPKDAKLAATTDGRISNWTVKVVDEAGIALEQGVDGEVLVRGPALMIGYGDDEQTQQALDPDGYFRTGDIGHVTAAGAIVITDRKKDIIIRGGENISAREVEDVLHQHELIREVAVVAMTHPRLGEGVCAYLVTANSVILDLADIQSFLKYSGLAKQKWPERIEHCKELKKTASGKVRKDLLREKSRATSTP